ncbi:unnamed protein product [Prunus armeniaca]
MQEASQKLGFYLGEEHMEFSSFSSGPNVLSRLGKYNRYWLFLGPCNAYDPGHRRVYFESSEDGHWEVIDTEEALCALLSVLDDRGKREALLIESLEKRIAFLCQAMSSRMVNSDRIDNLAQSDQSELDSVREDTYSPVSDVDNNLSGIANDSLPSSGVVVLEVRKKGEQQKQKWSRIQAISPSALPQIFKNALTVPILLDIINEEMDLAVNYLDNLTRVPRFDTLIMFLSSSDNDAMHASIWDEVLDNEATPIEYAEKLDNLHTKYCPKR